MAELNRAARRRQASWERSAKYKKLYKQKAKEAMAKRRMEVEQDFERKTITADSFASKLE